MKRSIQAAIIADLKKKMVLVGGARQVGKTITNVKLILLFCVMESLNLQWNAMLEKKP